MRSLLLLGGLLATGVYSKQPSAPIPKAAPMRELQWGQLNILATTDTHGWHAGHLQEASYSGDWGDYISFASHMRRIAKSSNQDLLVVDTGDRVDGNGLYDGSDPKGLYTSEVFKQQSVDLICSGNHELYRSEAAEREFNVTVPDFRDNYLASNLDIRHPETGNRTQMSRRYKIFTTPKQGLRILSMGFLFDFTGGAENVFVTPVEETVRTDWFQDAIKEENVDVFIIVGHVAPRSQEWKAVYTEIRKQHWDTPILFFSGHSHVRDFVQLDSKAVAFQSGRYLETIGFLSIGGLVKKDLATKFQAREAAYQANSWIPWWLPTTIQVWLERQILPELTDDEEEQEIEWAKGIQINRRYIDNNPLGYQFHTHTNASTFPTSHGLNISSTIAEARKKLDLDKTYGCAPKTYYANLAPYPHEDSLFTLMVDELLPSVLDEKHHGNAQSFIEGNGRPKIALMNTGGLRFDVFAGKFTRDTVFIVSPFENRWKVIRNVPWKTAKHVLPLINSGGQVMLDSDAFETADIHMSKADKRVLNEMWRLAPPEQTSWKEDRVFPQSHSLKQQHEARKLWHDQKQKFISTEDEEEDVPTFEIRPGYTTIDDLDDKGDDTVHFPLNYYRVPNAIQAQVGWEGKSELDFEESVDVVFLDFVQPWIVIALKFMGQKVEEGDVESYLEAKGFTTMIKEWVQENWACGNESRELPN